jgi:hypothetical protein
MPESRDVPTTPPADGLRRLAMREYNDHGEFRDDHIRLYTPVLQRVIILTAVIIAVPVLMWTVTTFVRSYVARPKVPVPLHVAASESPARGPVASPTPPVPAQPPADQAATAPPRSDTGPALGDAQTPGPEIRKGPPVAPASRNAIPAGPAVGAANTAPPIQAKPVQGSDPAAAVSPAGAAAGSTAPAAAAPRPIPTLRPGENTAAVAPSASDRGFAWPNPNSTSPPGFGPPAATPAASTPPPLPRTATAEVLPPGEPLRGPIPLPRQRPTVYAVAAVASSGAVPLPRVRPPAASADTASPVTIAPYSYEPGLVGN